MARRWTPQRFVMLRRIRVAVCVVAVVASMAAAFGVSARKAVALNVNGRTTTVETYAMSVDRLLQEQGIDVKTHDLVQSTSGERLTDHAVVTVRSAFQTTVTVDGEEIPFWTVADSADQLIGFFRANEKQASKITVDIGNVYNQLTGGLVINSEGPVTVIADGKTSVAPNGKLPAASILDSKGINVGKEDRVTVTKDGDTTILRVQRVTHGQETRVKTVPFTTRTVVDDSLQPGQTVVRQQGVNGSITQVYDVTYVDGVKESESLNSETTTQVALDQIIAVGPAKSDTSGDSGNSGDSSGSGDSGSNGSGTGSGTGNGSTGGSTGGDTTSKPNTGNGSNNSNNSGNSNQNQNNSSKPNTDTSKPDDSGSADQPGADDSTSSGGSTNSGGSTSKPNTNNNSNNSGTTSKPNTNTGGSNSNNSGNTGSGGSSASGRLWHPSVSQAKTYAAAAAAQRGWTGAEWDALEWIWEHESNWRWNADNPTSDAYGIPQALPGSKMGTGWQDDGAVQIDWGLSYIAGRYGSPTKAKTFWLKNNWY